MEVSPLIFACRHQPSVVSLLIEHGADIDSRDIFSAISIRNDRVVRLLIQHGADIHLKNNQGYSPLESITRWPIPYAYPVDELKQILYPYEQIYTLKEWRPWNHSKYPFLYRQAMITMAILAKSRICT